MRFSLLLVCAAGLAGALRAADAPVSYARQVRPLLAARCVACHQESNRSAGLSLATHAAVQAAAPQVLAAVSGSPPRMPKAGPPLTAAEVGLLKRWVAEGAANDARSPEGELWWSLRPLPPSRPGSLDAFIRARLRQAGLSPSPPADRRTLIRRVMADLHGLLPTPEEIQRFVADPDPLAYEKLVDALLASPRYGERQARHWLDVIHYGDTHGYDKDKPRLNAWPYRDWVIAAFNHDLPYRRFVEDQLAGDVLRPDDPQGIVATGFIAAGPWDFVGHQELREGTTDKNLTRVLDRDDMVAATLSTFTSTTAHCARCHDHKFDPIPQKDYYALQAVFAGVDRADRPYDDDPALHRARQALLERQRRLQLELQPLLDRVDYASSPEITALDDRIQDAKLLLAHLGAPKTEAEKAEKATLQARVEADTKQRKALVDALVGPAVLARIETLRAQARLLQQEAEALPKPKLVYAAARYFPTLGRFRPSLEPRPVHRLARGNVQSPQELIAPGALGAVPGLDADFSAAGQDEGARRAALARWITSDRNVLTWRSIVNRVWHHHFGAGLSDSPNDFGRMGTPPTHPELLDWLAVWFRDEAKGSLKALHRLIVTSQTYRQASTPRAEAAARDGENRLLWRMNRTRLDAETVHDSVLRAAGKLDLRMGGPGDRLFFFKDDHSPVYDYARHDPDASPRRAIYRFIVRSVQDPFFERLDCPDPSLLSPKRNTTLTAIQALALLNNPFMVRMAEHLAARAGSVEHLFWLTLGRAPSPAETLDFSAYAKKHGLANTARLLVNGNEFLFVD